LNKSAAIAFQHCSKGSSYGDLRADFGQQFGPEQADALVAVCLDTLEKNELIQVKARPKTSTRREFVRSAALAASLPVVLFVAAPTPGAAGSFCAPLGGCTPAVANSPCTPGCNLGVSLCTTYVITVSASNHVTTFDQNAVCCGATNPLSGSSAATSYTYFASCTSACTHHVISICCVSNHPGSASAFALNQGAAGAPCLYCGVPQDTLCVTTCNAATGSPTFGQCL
jgi:hypothetical protein